MTLYVSARVRSPSRCCPKPSPARASVASPASGLCQTSCAWSCKTSAGATEPGPSRSPRSCSSTCFPFRTFEMPGCRIRHAIVCRNKFIRIRRLQTTRRWSRSLVKTLRPVLLALNNLDHLFTHHDAINNQREANHERNDSRQPDAVQELSVARILSRNRVHNEMQKDRYPDAHTAHDHARFDFVVALNFGRDAELAFHLALAQFVRLARHEHLGHPRVVPVELP